MRGLLLWVRSGLFGLATAGGSGGDDGRHDHNGYEAECGEEVMHGVPPASGGLLDQAIVKHSDSCVNTTPGRGCHPGVIGGWLLLCRGFEDGCRAIEGRGQGVELRLGAGCVFGVDAFCNAGDDDGGVAGVLAGSVDGVAIPAAFG